MKAIVDKDICIGCSLCVDSCPAVFRMEDDKAYAYADPVPESEEKRAKQAAEECPVSAITIQS